MTASTAVMAVVHVKAPRAADPYLIEAELTRAINSNRKCPMSAELSLATEVRPQPRHGLHHHGFVAVLSLPGAPGAGLDRRIGKIARKAMRRRFGRKASAVAHLSTSADHVRAFWCTVRGTPHRLG